MKIVNFSPAIEKYAVGEYTIYAQPNKFKRFSVEKGNIVWGKNWDLVFPLTDIYDNK